jgi:rhomboid family GlyGly-CTERM serine protease
MSLRPPPHGLHAPLTAALAGCALILLLQAVPAVLPLLEYRRAALLSEPWRLLTGHFVHVNWSHALVNAGAWLLLARLFAPQLDARRQLLSLLLGAAFISLTLVAWHPSIAWYRGASGALHALYFAGATAAIVRAARARTRRSAGVALALLAGGWIKVALEQPGGSATPYAEWLAAATVPQAHLLGAVAGTLLGVLFAERSLQEPRSSR